MAPLALFAVLETEKLVLSEKYIWLELKLHKEGLKEENFKNGLLDGVDFEIFAFLYEVIILFRRNMSELFKIRINYKKRERFHLRTTSTYG